MRLRPIPASDYIYFDEKHRELLKEFGGVAVNDKLLPVWKNDYDIGLFFGGRGGGKSEVTCDKLLDDAMNSEYFKCYYGRKVFDTIRGSCFSTLIYCIKKNKLEEYFSYSEADNSSMIITCRLNKNKFIPFGSDKADKLKSIKDPTHIWCEEFDQFAFTDFKELYPTLRTIRGANIFIGTFNTHGVLPNHWILKVFFPDLYQGLDKEDVQHVDLMTGKRLKKVFVNFTDNYFIDQESYRQNLWLSSAGNTTIFEGLANGAWGVMVNESPWLFAFDRKKHVAKTELIATRRETLYLTFDFNRNPAACTVIQWPDQK
jgi:PBSX family phage terminase large subunit